MGLMDIARQDFANITSDPAGFGISISMRAPNGQTATVVGYHTRHWMQVDAVEGTISTNSVTASICVAESVIAEANSVYPVRTSGRVDLVDHIIKCKDSTGVLQSYRVTQVGPDEALGGIIMFLSESND